MSLFKETIVISVGGSLLIPDQVDVPFIKHLKEMIVHFVSEDYQIALVIGGGKTSRNYCKAASEFHHVNDTDLDWIGIKTIHLNAEFVLRIFSDIDVHRKVILKQEDIRGVSEAVVIVGAWQPGHSSDFNAVSMAQEIGAQRVINFSNVTHVYDKDPVVFNDAQKINTLSWDEYKQIIPQDWTPNMSAPFDPIASAKAQELGMTVAILGASVENLQSYLRGEDFEGSIIS